MAKSNTGTAFRCTIFSPIGQHTVKGKLLEVEEGNFIKFKYKKPRSSRYAVRVIPWSDIIKYSDTEATFRTPKAPVKTYNSATVDTEKFGMVRLVTDEKETVFVKADCLEATADDDSVQEEIKDKSKVDKKKKKEATK